ncbi:glycosyl hydrolase family 18 [Mobilitalea sibirica]|uniref:Glycosyl hydrolase family 18 n=1 Tax=Mobilitalea sibirica TaxID=1462919 RepID=A0A8J7H6R4_9FIRM|nr:glycosyl hydrolase family 18 protein [Mobilitalea sibirica]MBH1940711.1 glycosyl hydrolase family 18 [Mobilitalea sibirica]
MDKRVKITIIGSVIMVVAIAISLGVVIKNKLTPSNEVMLLTEYYPIENSEVMLIVQDEIYQKNGKMIEDTIYIDYETVVELFNHRFYWDEQEEVLTYTTPTDIIRAEPDRVEYTIESIDKTNENADYPIVRMIDTELYLALDFVKQYSDIDVRIYEEPNRVIITYRWGEFLYTEVTKDTKLRLEPSIKSPILTELITGMELLYVNLEEPPKNGFFKVMTQDGIIGYVRDRFVKESYYKTLTSPNNMPEYTTQKRQEKINLVFHQVFGQNEADNLETLINATKGVNVVSPTWFSITDNQGTISSLASQDYMEKASELGLEVWALVDDFNPEVDMKELLSHTTRRDKLSGALMEAVKQFKLDGINIDFEVIPTDAGKDYVQFLRELSVKCRNNNIVLSVDNFVPPFKKHYDREEQGKIVDYVIIMAYDEYYSGSADAGPNSSIGFVEDAVRNTLKEVPQDKLIIAIPFYTRLWKEMPDGDVSREKDYAMTPAAQVLEDNGVEALWDETYGSYYAEYEKDGALYRMWQEEERSIEEKMKVIHEADLAGIAAWKLGLEKESVWDIIIKYLEN